MPLKGLMEGPGDTVVSGVVQLLETTKKDRKNRTYQSYRATYAKVESFGPHIKTW